MTLKKKKSETAGSELSFEKALERLEQIVEEMESSELPLSEVLKRYEEGTQLIKLCSQQLEEAEKRVDILTKTKDGAPLLRKFQAVEENGSEQSAEHDSTEGKLL